MIFKRCKAENTKLTSFLNVLAGVANFRLFHKHKTHTPYTLDTVPISLRQYRPDLDPLQLGNCVGGLVTVIVNGFENPCDDDEIRAKFWSIAREQSDSLVERVRNDYSKFFRSNSVSIDVFPGLFFHFSISNVGVVDLDKYECFGKENPTGFRIENMFATIKCRESIDKFLAMIFVCTVGESLCCCLGTNTFFFDPVVADEFVRIFNETLLLVI